MSSKRKVRIKHEEVVERFARRLKELRLQRGMTQAELAKRARVTTTYISKLESAGAAPGIDLVEKLAVALGAELNDLIPLSLPQDTSAAARNRARELFEELLELADQQTFSLLNPLLALLVEASGKRA
jgi:transcriptional regulator with XRE-family HTH domain